MQTDTLRAFELIAIGGVPAEEVAALCGILVDAVSVVKTLLANRLRVMVLDLTAAYDGGAR